MQNLIDGVLYAYMQSDPVHCWREEGGGEREERGREVGRDGSMEEMST